MEMIPKIPSINYPYLYGKRDTECIYELLGKKKKDDDFQSVLNQEVAKLKGEVRKNE